VALYFFKGQFDSIEGREDEEFLWRGRGGFLCKD
jgi:hypothetical protein